MTTTPATVADAERAAFDKFWATEKALNGGAAIGADYHHWAMKGYVAGCAAAPVGADVAADEADAYSHACEIMEQHQAKRAKRGVEIGTEGSLCDGIEWLYGHIEKLELAAGAPAETPRNRSPYVLGVKPSDWAEQIVAGMPDKMGKSDTFSYGTIVRKKSGSEWQGIIVGTYSSSITPEGYAVESSTHRGSVQIYPVSALELVTKGGA